MRHFSLTLFLFAGVLITACQKAPKTGPEDLAKKIAPDGFNFNTTKKVDLNIRLLSNTNEPISGAIVNVTSPKTKEVLLKGASDAQGYLKTSVTIPAHLDTLIIDPNYVGLIKGVQALVKNNAVSCVIGGAEGLSGNVVLPTGNNQVHTGETSAKNTSKTLASTSYSYMGTYDSYGRPFNYLDATKGTVSANLLSAINASLPETKDVSVYRPEYINEAATQNLNIVTTTDVYITFVSEGAGYQNALGYYTYPTNNPPKNRNKIDQIKYIFPNASALGSGGNLRSGDRVKISSVPAGHSVGFVIFANGWDASAKKVNKDAIKYYSDKALNPEPTGPEEIHTVLLHHKSENLFVVGIEDLPRYDPQGDNDFNDVVIYATSSVANAISKVGVSELKTPNDADSDGILDNLDESPNDATRAFTSYFPSKTSWATLAFEDNWPQKGDYDVNDLVVNYRYTMIANASNDVVEMTGEFTPVAAGASYYNGFGVQFPFTPADVQKVTGHKLVENYITLNTNGTEAGQSKAVIIPFDNHEALIKNHAGTFFINTKESMEKVTGQVATVNIKFNSPMTPAKLGTAPFNPFLISNKRRGYEIHLPGSTPTNKADNSLFGKNEDDSKPASGRYYLSKENGPWVISFSEPFKYPSELNAIGDAYPHFSEWANSGGTLFQDWYSNTGSGYRNNSKIYSK